MTNVKLNKNRDLLDPNFSGYKLSLDSVAVTTTDIPPDAATSHLNPSNDQYSFLHAKLYGEHNHLVGDPWSRTDSVYWLSTTGHVYRLTRAGGGRVDLVWTPGHVSRPEENSGDKYNSKLLFLGRTIAAVSDGSGRLDLINTGGQRDQASGGQWRTVFSDLVCGQDRPLLVAGGEVGAEGQIEVVVQYVEEKEGGFNNILEWITFSEAGDNSFMMERVRRLVTRGGVNMVTVTGGRLVVSGQRAVRLVFDSMVGEEEEITEAEMEAVGKVKADKEAEAGFYWRQTEQDVELWCYTSNAVTKSSVQVSVDRGRDVEFVVGGVVMVRGQLQASVESDSWTWSLGGGKLGLMMTKEAEAVWPGGCLWSQEAGPEATRGIEVTDDTEDTILANMTTENPIVDNEDNKNAFNSEQLEDVDSYEDTDIVTWLGEGGEVTAEANMTGYQHLCNVMEADSASPSLVTRHDVDGLVWRLSPETMTHVATFPALGYVQASKTARKFISAPSSWGYSIISDNSRHLYVYRQPQDLAEETELRNRRSGQKVSQVAKQQVITLDSQSDILGLVALSSVLVVLTKDKLFSCQL